MGDDGRLTVTPAALVVHAGDLDRIADGVAQARQAAETCQPSADSYGQLCVMVPMLLGGLHDLMVDGLATGEASIRESAGRLRDASDRYDSTDAANAAGMDATRTRGSP